uniref:Small ribosomal subunit protein uS10c n=1 Tax=Toxarium undulatum TaxID=210620 RepID=A0A1D8DCV6_9STRA|nr:ribosomal protein S10 [Toxarium undulatum]AOS86674.1 ribosomal protein S10 [Toxarium undulatum]
MNSTLTTKIRIRLESFNSELLTSYCQKIVDTLKNNGITYLSMVSLPTRKKIYCVLRSPHVDKDSREHFELRTHKRLLEIYFDSNINIFNLLISSDLPSGIIYRISLS